MNNEQLFQQRLQERTGGQYQQAPQSQSTSPAQGNPYFQIDLSQLPPPSVQASSLNPTPDKIMQFAQMDHGSRLQLAQTNQQLYADIVNSVQRVQQSSSSFSPSTHQPQQLQQHQPPLQPQQHQPPLQPQQHQSQQHYGQFNNDEDDSSELSNHHSSDEELNGPTNTSAQRQTISTAVMQQPQSFRSVVRHKPRMSSYLPIDFRADLVDIGSFMRYQVQFSKRHNVRSLKLTEFIVNIRPELLQEPYIFIKIDEIEGNYKLGGRFNTTVFGKLVQDKTMNGFLFYKPEHCSIRFSEPQRLTNLTVSLLNYDMTPISLSKLVVSDIKKSANFIRLVCSDDHHLHPSNAVAITYDSEDGRTTTERLEILDIPTLNSVVLQKPQNLVFNRNVSFEVLNIKCSMTFKLT